MRLPAAFLAFLSGLLVAFLPSLAYSTTTTITINTGKTPSSWNGCTGEQSGTTLTAYCNNWKTGQNHVACGTASAGSQYSLSNVYAQYNGSTYDVFFELTDVPECELQGNWVINAEHTDYECIGSNCTREGEVIGDGSCPQPKPTVDPTHCYDGEKAVSEIGQTETETGIDCGGECSAECADFCPSGTSLETRQGPDGFIAPYCVSDSSVAPDPLGNCPEKPSGHPWLKDGSGNCVDWSTPISAAPGFADAGTYTQPDNPFDQKTSGSETSTTTTTTENPDGSTTVVQTDVTTTTDTDGKVTKKETKQTTTTTNADGSKTVTETTTTTTLGGDGKSTTTSTTTTEGFDSSGNSTGRSTSTTTGTGSSGDGSGNTGNGTGVSGPEGANGDVDTEKVGKFSTRLAEFTAAVQQAPVFQAFSGVFELPSGGSPSTSIDAGSYGNFDFDLGPYSSALDLIGWMLVGCAMFVAARLILANK